MEQQGRRQGRSPITGSHSGRGLHKDYRCIPAHESSQKYRIRRTRERCTGCQTTTGRGSLCSNPPRHNKCTRWSSKPLRVHPSTPTRIKRPIQAQPHVRQRHNFEPNVPPPSHEETLYGYPNDAWSGVSACEPATSHHIVPAINVPMHHQTPTRTAKAHSGTLGVRLASYCLSSTRSLWT